MSNPDDIGKSAFPPGMDFGSDREKHAKPCAKRTWCTEVVGHDGPCLEVVGSPPERNTFDRGRAKR